VDIIAASAGVLLREELDKAMTELLDGVLELGVVVAAVGDEESSRPRSVAREIDMRFSNH
jgi:hypothetical protein